MNKSKFIMINFVKMTGAGNDFILIDNRSEQYSIDWIKLAPIICNRRYGVGADGLLVIEKSNKADFKMNYFNADGSYGGMCGNGGRCSALFVMNAVAVETIKFEALDFIYTAETTLDNKIKLKMKPPNLLRLNLELNLLNENIIAHFIDTGAPHLVLFIDDLPNSIKSEINEIGIKRIGSLIRYNDKFTPAGTNVNFIEIINDKNIIMRTYERGVEDETLACGTGAIASAIIASILKNFNCPIYVYTRSKEILEVSFEKNRSDIENVELIGSAKKIFDGNYQIVF